MTEIEKPDPWALLDATAMLCQGNVSHELFQGRRNEMAMAHIPQISEEVGILVNPGSIRTQKFSTLEQMALCQFAQAEVMACNLLHQYNWNALLSYTPEWYGYSPRFDPPVERKCDVTDFQESILLTRYATLTTLDSKHEDLYAMHERLCVDLLIPELPAYYAVYIWAIKTGHPLALEFIEVNTPGPRWFLDCYPEHKWDFNLAHLLKRRYNYPSSFDGSSLMCEAYRVFNHLTGKVNLAEKRPRRALR